MRNPEIPVEPPVIAITVENVSMVHSMLVREIGQDEKTVVKTGETRTFKVPYQGLIIGYQERSGNHGST